MLPVLVYARLPYIEAGRNNLQNMLCIDIMSVSWELDLLFFFFFEEKQKMLDSLCR